MLEKCYVVMRRKPLTELPWLSRMAIRLAYFKTGWASDYSLELQGVFDSEAEARWASSGTGMTYMEIPFNASLPEETAQYGTHDFPLSEASSGYRKRKLGFVAIARTDLALLSAKVEDVHHCLDGECDEAIA